MLNLLIKDFKLMFSKDKKLAKRILAALFTIFFIGCFIVIEVYFFSAILNEIKIIRKAPLIFMTLFLFIISIILMISGIFQAMKLFFNKKDLEQLSTFPVTNSQIIISKMILLFFMHYVTSIMFIYPLFVAYARIMYQQTLFYYLGLFYPIFTFFLEIGVALLFVYPFWLLLQFLKNIIDETSLQEYIESIKNLPPQKIVYELFNYTINNKIKTKDDMSLIALKIEKIA